MLARSSSRFGLAFVLLATSACDAPSGEFSVRDSAGVEVVESRQPVWSADEAWRVGEPTVTIGTSLEGGMGQQLDRVVAATRLSDGTIVIADAGARALLRYDASGRYLGSTGRAGDGPGEFRALNWVGKTAGDSLLTWDRGLGRVSVFTASGELARQYLPSLTELPMSLEVKGQLSGGRLVLARGAGLVSREGSPGVQRQPITAWLISATGEEMQPFGPLPGETVFLDASQAFMPVPLGAVTLFAARDDAVYVVDTETFAASVFDHDGALSGIVRRHYPRRAIEPEDVEADIDARMAELPSNLRNRDAYRRRFQGVPLPERLPAVRAVHVDTENHLWLEEVGAAGETSASWSVFDRDGRWLGDVRIPGSLTMLEIGPDYILGREQDELDVHRVVLLPLERRTP